jgi:hypothetical protein
MSKKDGASYIHTEFLVPQHGTDQWSYSQQHENYHMEGTKRTTGFE